MEDITNFIQVFEKALAEKTERFLCTRDEFVRTIMQHLLRTDYRQVNMLFSSLDPDRTNTLDYRDFIAALRVFRNPRETVRDKLAAIFSIYVGDNVSQDGSIAVSRPVAKQILYTCCATISDQETLDDAISAKVGKQMRAKTALHETQNYASRESFLGLSYVDASGVAAALGGTGSSSMSGRAGLGIRVTLEELWNALDTHPEVEQIFEEQLCARLEAAGFEGRPAKPFIPVEKIDLTKEDPSAARLRTLMNSTI